MNMDKPPKVDFVRSEVSEKIAIWKQIDDCDQGAKAIKEAGETYLPKPNCSDDPSEVKKNYDAYKKRAVFYNVLGRTKRGLIGQVFNTPPKEELPNLIEPLLLNIDGSGSTLIKESKKTLGRVLSNGRAGLLCDFPTMEDGQIITKDQSVLPRVFMYEAANIINWNTFFHQQEIKLEFVILSESYTKSTDGYQRETDTQYRELRLDTELNAVVVKVWRKDSEKEGAFIQYGADVYLRDYNGNPFTEIPFVFVGSEDNDSIVDQPPLYDLSEVNLAHYRNSADYEESSYLVGQPTPYFAGLTKDWVKNYFAGKVTLGSKKAVPLPVGATAGMLQASPNMLAKDGMLHKEEQMKALGAKLVEPKTGNRTATETELEAGADSSVLSTIANNVSEAYKKAIYFCSKFLGEVSEDEIIFQLNTDFAIARMSAQDRQQLIAEWQSGAITFGEMRGNLLKDGVATIKDNEDAKDEMENTIIGGGDE